MPTDPAKLASLMRDAIASATKAYAGGGSLAAYEKAMQAIITRGHLSGWMAGTSERMNVPLDSPLLSQRRLSKAERADIRAAVEAQLKYFRGFVGDMDGMSEAQIAARANLYAGATRQTYFGARWGEWEIPAGLMPGNQACKSNCLCRISVADNEDGTGVLSREMGGAERHCTECPTLVGDHDVKRRAA